MTRTHYIAIALSAGLLAATIRPVFAGPVVRSGSGANPAAIQSTVDTFRTDLGALNANVAGTQNGGAGRREINWDGVPNNLAAPNDLPANFFNVNSPRGAVFSGGSGVTFQVSANSGVAGIEFDTINDTYSTSFQTFSAQRLFTSLGNNFYDVNFFVPGSTNAAFVRGFGSVFTDVDLANTTSIQYFDTNNNSLGTFFAPVANNGLSFLGVSFDAGERVGRVRITNGNTALGAGINDVPNVDLVVNDDFIYAEPVAVVSGAAAPEPGSLALLLLAPIGFVAARLRSRRAR